MPTVILFDLSLSMSRTVALSDSHELFTLQNLANYGLIGLLDHMSTANRLEHVCLMYFSSLWERSVYFTRDYETVKLALANNCNTFYDVTNVANALKGANDYVLEDWGNKIPVQVLLITDGRPGLSALCSTRGVAAPLTTKAALAGETSGTVNSTTAIDQLVQFGFACKLHVLNMCTRNENALNDEAHAFYRRLIADTCSANNTVVPDDQIWYLESYSLQSVSNMFQKLAEQHYQPYHAQLNCGSLSSPVSLFPSLERYTDTSGAELIVAEPNSTFEICGFLALNEVASPPVHSRHLLLPRQLDKAQLTQLHGVLNLPPNISCDLSSHTCQELADSLETLEQDESKQPSLCLLLHGSLKVEGMVAICRLGEPEWFGMLYTWSDNKKKSNLMLSSFKCGPKSIAWLDNLHLLGISSLNTKLSAAELTKAGKAINLCDCYLNTTKMTLFGSFAGR
jgi:hypothetical protein